MKILVLFFLLCSFQVVSQEDTTVYEYVDEDAEFPGGMSALLNWVLKEIEFKQGEICELQCQSKIYLKFIVEIDGSISNIECTDKYNLLQKDLEEVFVSSPKWNPGKINGRLVRSYFSLPINIHWE